jgi:hypothetical protein
MEQGSKLPSMFVERYFCDSDANRTQGANLPFDGPWCDTVLFIISSLRNSLYQLAYSNLLTMRHHTIELATFSVCGIP